MFFETWALWQKMTFVLACAIVFTFCIAFGKRAHNSWKLRQFRADEVTHKASAAAVPLTYDLEAQSAAVPFGIRALDHGISVEGVWVSPRPSRDNTPSSSISSLPTLELAPMQEETARRINNEAVNRTAAHSRSVSDSNATQAGAPIPQNSSLHPAFAQRRSLAAEHWVGERRIRGRSLPRDIGDWDLTSRGTRSHQRRSYQSSTSLEPSTGAGYNIRSGSPTMTDPLELMQRHRLSQVASTGMLTPRSLTLPDVLLTPDEVQSPSLDDTSHVFSWTGRVSPTPPYSDKLTEDLSATTFLGNDDRRDATEPQIADSPPGDTSDNLQDSMRSYGDTIELEDFADISKAKGGPNEPATAHRSRLSRLSSTFELRTASARQSLRAVVNPKDSASSKPRKLVKKRKPNRVEKV